MPSWWVAALNGEPACINKVRSVNYLVHRLLVNHSLFLVFLKTKVLNGICLSPRLSKNLSQALRTDKIWPRRRSLNFSSSRLEFESWGPTGLSSPNLTRKTDLLFIGVPLFYRLRGSLVIDPIKKFNKPLTIDPKEDFIILWIILRKSLIAATENGLDIYPNLTVD